MFPNEPGLSDAEAKASQKIHGLNVLPEKPPPGNIVLIVQQLKNPLVYVLLLAGIVTFAIGHVTDALIICIAVGLNTILGFIQERKAVDALHALKHYVSSTITVVREKRRVSIETSQLVPGDIVILGQGVKIPADGRLREANRLSLDESMLTGESVSVMKTKSDPVFMGTTVVSGQAVMVVEKIGKDTRMGAIALQIQEAEEDTPLQRQLKRFSTQLVVIIGVLITLVFAVGVLYRFSVKDMFITSVALAVSSIPEGLIVSMTVVLAIGMQKILKRRGLVKKLAAAETLGGVTVICVDKTGTLTQGNMKVSDVIGDANNLAEQVLLANDLDDPIVIAAFEWGRTIIHNPITKHMRFDSIPFSSKERFFSSLHQWSHATNRLYINGAPEKILTWTTLSEKERKEITTVINELTRQGKKLIGFARRDVPHSKKTLEVADAKKGLTWVGMLSFSDPVRAGVKLALEQAKDAGIRTMVITGDYAKTSEFVLSELGILLRNDEIITGDELEVLSKEEFIKKIQTIRLIARATPDQKLAIIDALKNRGEIVAMMGDGVNDAPALHKADIGIAVGEASDVSKESADLVLLDSNFSTIVGAIEEGRTMFENIRKIILFLLCDAFSEIVIILGGIVLGFPLPITAVQILWINLISDGFPGLALTIDPKRVDIMKEKPRYPGERLVNTWMSALIGFVSVIAGLLTLASFIIVYTLTGDLVVARSMAFIMLGINTLVYVYSVRTLMTPFWKNHLFENRWLSVAVIAGFGLQVFPFLHPALRQFFGLTSLSPIYWLTAFGLSLCTFLLVEIFKYVYQWKKIKIP